MPKKSSEIEASAAVVVVVVVVVADVGVLTLPSSVHAAAIVAIVTKMDARITGRYGAEITPRSLSKISARSGARNP